MPVGSSPHVRSMVRVGLCADPGWLTGLIWITGCMAAAIASRGPIGPAVAILSALGVILASWFLIVVELDDTPGQPHGVKDVRQATGPPPKKFKLHGLSPTIPELVLIGPRSSKKLASLPFQPSPLPPHSWDRPAIGRVRNRAKCTNPRRKILSKNTAYKKTSVMFPGGL